MRGAVAAWAALWPAACGEGHPAVCRPRRTRGQQPVFRGGGVRGRGAGLASLPAAGASARGPRSQAPAPAGAQHAHVGTWPSRRHTVAKATGRAVGVRAKECARGSSEAARTHGDSVGLPRRPQRGGRHTRRGHGAGGCTEAGPGPQTPCRPLPPEAQCSQRPSGSANTPSRPLLCVEMAQCQAPEIPGAQAQLQGARR